MSTTLKSRTVTGMRWTLINAVGEKVLSIGTTMVLARMLDPEHFGLYALAFIVIDSFGIFKSLGLDIAIIQRRDRVETAANTVFMVLPLIGVGLCGVLYWIAPIMAEGIGHPGMAQPVQILGIVLIISALGNVPGALIQRAMQFHIRTIANLAAMVVYAVTAITLAMQGAGILSLVVAYVARWAVSVLIQWAMFRWVPRWEFDWTLLKEMFHYSKYVMGAALLGFLSTSADKLAIGYWLSTKQLGYYTLCLGLAHLVMTQLTRIRQVTFPAVSEAQSSPELLRQGFLKLFKYLLLFALPISMLLILVPSDLLGVLYGKRWIQAAPILQILAISGILEAIRLAIEPVLLGCGRSKTIFRLNIFKFTLLAIGAVTMARLGSVTGVAWAMVVSAGLPACISLWLVLRQLEIRPMEFLRQLRPVGFSLLAMGGTVVVAHLMRSGLRAGLGDVMNVHGVWLWGAIFAGGAAYLVGMFLWDPAMARDLMELMRIRLPKAARRADLRTPVLFVESGSGNGGSATCLVSLMRWIDRRTYRPLVAYYAEGVHIERLRQLGVDTFPLTRGWRFWQLLRLIRRERVQLIHNNNELYSQMSTMAVAMVTRLPCVCSLRATRGLTRWERLWVPFVRHFIAVSNATRMAYVQSGIPEDRIQAIWDGIDLERFSCIRRTGSSSMPEGIRLAPGRLTVGLVSRLVPAKGIDEFIRAARYVVDRFPVVQFLIVGGDPTPDNRYEREIRALTDQLGLTRYIMFTGWRSDLDAITPLFDIAAQASKYWEGLGISLLEGMACGKPTVATRNGGVTEVVVDGETGLLVTPGDSTALGEALLTLLQDAPLRRRMGEAGRRRVEQHFDQRQLAKQVERVYEWSLNGRDR